MSDLEELKEILANGSFHHATYRNIGTLWEGLYIYLKAPEGFIFGENSLVFGKRHPDLLAAEDLVRHTGISVGAYGNG